jgi:hypothetical protein
MINVREETSEICSRKKRGGENPNPGMLIMYVSARPGDY